MSYQILYKAQFIKLDTNRIIPMIEEGGGKDYYANSRKRCRDWWCSSRHMDNSNGRFIINQDVFIHNINTLRCNMAANIGDYTDDKFGYFAYAGLAISGHTTHKTTFAMYKNFMLKGIKNALSVEDIRNKHCLGLNLMVSRYCKETILKLGLEVLPDVHITTTKQLLETLEKYETYYPNEVSLYLNFTKVYPL